MNGKLVNLCIVILILSAALSFIYNGVNGKSGLQAGRDAMAEAETLSQDLAALRAERMELENLTRRLSPDYLDIDLLDERARDVLGYIRPDEIVIR